MDDTYTRRCDWRRVIDGDTLLLRIDLGYHISIDQHVRLLGVDTPELRSSDAQVRARALLAKEFVLEWENHHRHDAYPTPFPFMLRSHKGDSFGRWLGEMFCVEGHDLSTDLMESGHAVLYSR